ncbi:uncharacterized protein MYCFIDRAFT_177169 [Pseudocercospora fijiensis CIRAD86]|uniref:Uncharacterized protein n=1 Tax=Pseudocercospora fijiensis (strain CIRAD86) TaxID=383855 RepID=M2YR69_PSEFD|nr:uncharacterized protein MYCFIDRAFT_177169 [Pseudocercospora fijiensis CIRAD86]EME80200.1 hypothetical protein MYCFIDRAFT_177169 [Pseudocercospora fijiensis CIRAD86]
MNADSQRVNQGDPKLTDSVGRLARDIATSKGHVNIVAVIDQHAAIMLYMSSVQWHRPLKASKQACARLRLNEEQRKLNHTKPRELYRPTESMTEESVYDRQIVPNLISGCRTASSEFKLGGSPLGIRHEYKYFQQYWLRLVRNGNSAGRHPTARLTQNSKLLFELHRTIHTSTMKYTLSLIVLSAFFASATPTPDDLIRRDGPCFHEDWGPGCCDKLKPHSLLLANGDTSTPSPSLLLLFRSRKHWAFHSAIRALAPPDQLKRFNEIDGYIEALQWLVGSIWLISGKRTRILVEDTSFRKLDLPVRLRRIFFARSLSDDSIPCYDPVLWHDGLIAHVETIFFESLTVADMIQLLGLHVTIQLLRRRDDIPAIRVRMLTDVAHIITWRHEHEDCDVKPHFRQARRASRLRANDDVRHPSAQGTAP